MATLSSHTLNGVDGSHAVGISVSLYCLHDSQTQIVFSTTMDSGGRLQRHIEPEQIDTSADYELVFDTAAYWQAKLATPAQQIMQQVRLRFNMPDANGSYHMPIIISPHSYSVWWSKQ